MKTLETLQMREFTPEEHVVAFSKWHNEANSRNVLRVGQSRDQYLMEYLESYPKVKHLVSDNALLKDAWALANDSQSYQPDFSKYFTSPNMHRIISWCFYIQHLADAKKFQWFLSCREAGRYLGVSHTEANQMIKTLIRFEILSEVEKSTHAEARRLKYTGINH